MRLILLALFAAVPMAALADPVEHRLSPAEAAAAVDAGAERNRAADALALARTDPAMALPGEDLPGRDRKLHGEAGVAFGSNGERELFGSVNTSLGGNSVATFGYDYSQFGNRIGRRERNR